MSFHENIAGPTVAANTLAGTTDSLADVFKVPAVRPVAANLNSVDAIDDALYASFKRALDLIVAVSALALLAPLFALIALAIKLDSKGPVFFHQHRHGLNGRLFTVLKFRSMNVLEDGDVIVQATRNDSRITRVGRFLRISSLDELPQLVNVILGEMSIIGPRPHARAHDEMYARLLDCYTGRQKMKPGITGWAQVNGLRGETATLEAMRARVDYDLWYVNNANIALDLEILLRTVLEVLRHRNAY
jgi:undecaprenyl-phosphate galactose phosphotransferase/putative colanic acid biosynthesis UDP-glucose lipid carrier transferase